MTVLMRVAMLVQAAVLVRLAVLVGVPVRDLDLVLVLVLSLSLFEVIFVFFFFLFLLSSCLSLACFVLFWVLRVSFLLSSILGFGFDGAFLLSLAWVWIYGFFF